MKKLLIKVFPVSLLIILALYVGTRLYNLTILPIFTDESIYIYWAKVIESTHAQYFISLTDGKPPLLIWMTSIFLWILPEQWYLIAGRLPSVIAGLVSTVAIYHLARLLSQDKRVGILGAILYVIFPYTLLYDRMALFDSLLQASLLTATLFAVITARKLQFRYALLWGIAMGFAYLSKPTALMFTVLLPFSAFVIHSGCKKRNWKKLTILAFTAVGIGEGINNLQRLSSVYEFMGRKNAQFQQPIEELLKNPFALTIGNFRGFSSWIIDYYTVPLLILGISAMVVLLLRSWRQGVILSVLWVVPIIGLATIGREIFPRYILFTTPYFLVGLALFLRMLYQLFGKYRYVFFMFLVVLVFPLLRNDYYILSNPPKASLPLTDYQQYVSLHPSGYGIENIIEYLDAQTAQGESVNLVTQGTFGLYPYAFMLEYWENPRVTVIPKWPLEQIDSEIIDASKQHKTYILLKEYEEIPENIPLRLVLKSEKPGGKNPLLLTELE